MSMRQPAVHVAKALGRSNKKDDDKAHNNRKNRNANNDDYETPPRSAPDTAYTRSPSPLTKKKFGEKGRSEEDGDEDSIDAPPRQEASSKSASLSRKSRNHNNRDNVALIRSKKQGKSKRGELMVDPIITMDPKHSRKKSPTNRDPSPPPHEQQRQMRGSVIPAGLQQPQQQGVGKKQVSERAVPSSRELRVGEFADEWAEVHNAANFLDKVMSNMDDAASNGSLDDAELLLNGSTANLDDVEKALATLRKHAKKLGVRETDLLLATAKSYDSDALYSEISAIVGDRGGGGGEGSEYQDDYPPSKNRGRQTSAAAGDDFVDVFGSYMGFQK